MAWRIEYLKASRRQLDKLDPQVATRVLQFMRERISESADPYALGKALTGKALTGKWIGHWAYRVGDHRIICRLDAGILLDMVVKVGHRSDVYD